MTDSEDNPTQKLNPKLQSTNKLQQAAIQIEKFSSHLISFPKDNNYRKDSPSIITETDKPIFPPGDPIYQSVGGTPKFTKIPQIHFPPFPKNHRIAHSPYVPGINAIFLSPSTTTLPEVHLPNQPATIQFGILPKSPTAEVEFGIINTPMAKK